MAGGQVVAGSQDHRQVQQGQRSDLDIADMHQEHADEVRITRLKGKIDHLRARMARLRQMEAAVAASPDNQVSLTDLDARATYSP